MANTIETGVSRRVFLATGATAIAATALTDRRFIPSAHAETGAIGTTMRERATRFLSLLDTAQHQAAAFNFDDRTRRAWNFMLGSRVAPGLPLERMTDEQKDAALDLLSSGLSKDGMTTAENIMLQQDILRDEWGKGSPDRNRERFSLMIFGTASETDAWGWRWEGHHLSLSYTLIGDEIVSVTPSAFSSEPNTVPSGPYRGLVVLPDEESLGRTVERELSAASRRTALIQESSFGNILAVAGRENRVQGESVGVPLGDLPQAQIDMVTRLIEVYTVDHLPAPLASGQAARIREGDLMSARFGWAGANRENESIYYRLTGDTFLIEFATLRGQPLHQHAVRHDFERNMGNHRV